ncbi:MAG: hypothetical protein ACXWDL_10560 [Nocardioides sp.]
MAALDVVMPERTAGRPPVARVATRWLVVAVVVAHGLLHLLGAVKGLGWAEVAQLRQQIDTSLGWAWLTTSALVVIAGILLALRSRRWWAVGAVAVVASQAMLFTSWSDARAGTVANLVLFAAVVHGYASWGPTSFCAEYHRRVRSALGDLTAVMPSDAELVNEAVLVRLPGPVAAYVRRSGAVGQPRSPASVLGSIAGSEVV